MTRSPRRKIESALDLPERPREMDSTDWEVWGDDAAGLLSDLYGETGYFDAAFRFVLGDSAAGGKDNFRIKVLVREGSRYKFGAVSVTGTAGGAAAFDQGDLKCRPGRDFEQALVFRDRRTLLNSFGDAGLPACQGRRDAGPRHPRQDRRSHVPRGSRPGRRLRHLA